MPNSVDSATSASAFANYNAVSRVPAKSMNQDDFLKILAAQLSSQDPLNPQKDSEFIGQMAQFTSLEQTKSMEAEISTLRADNLIGRNVILQPTPDRVVTGKVTSVQIVSGTPRLILDTMDATDGTSTYTLDKLVGITSSNP